MKKFVFFALFALLIFAFFASVAYAELEIEGLEDGKIYLANQYLDVSTYVNGEKADCEWTFSPDYAARLSSGKKIRLSDTAAAAEITMTAYHKETGSVKTITIFSVPKSTRINLYHNNKQVTDGSIFFDLSGGKTALQLFSATSPSGANAFITWTSSDETIAGVDSNGIVTFRAMGKCVISAKTVDGKTASVSISASFAAKNIDLIAPEELAVGEKASLFAIITPEEAAQDGVTWKSSKESVISVSENGEITAHRVGKATITATTISGVSRKVQIEAFLPVERIQFRNSFSIKVGQSDQLFVRVLPKEAKYRSVTFVSLNPEIATVDKYGFVTGITPGSVTIIASASNGVSTHVTLEIRPIKLENVTLSDQFETLFVGESASVSPVFTPENTTERSITYISSDPSVATVDENGVVTAVGEGKCVVYCQSERSDLTPMLFRVNVQSEGALPLSGLVIGINPGCQEISNRRELPLAPGSGKTAQAVESSEKGVTTKTPEYKITLEVSLLLKDALEKMGAQVVLTRTTHDVNLNNIERAEILNQAGADLTVQIHTGYSSNKKTSGITVRAKYSDSESQAIGQIILENACRVSGANMQKMHKSNSYISMNWSKAPSVYVECGYLSNSDEDVKLNSPVYQELIARGIAEGIQEYFAGSPIR